MNRLHSCISGLLSRKERSRPEAARAAVIALVTKLASGIISDLMPLYLNLMPNMTNVTMMHVTLVLNISKGRTYLGRTLGRANQTNPCLSLLIPN